MSANDVLEALGVDPPEPAAAEAPSEIGAAVLDAIASGAATPDEVVRVTGRTAGDVAAALVELELAGRVSADGGVYHVTTIPR
jgi:predicted Rossmann fold nucleotide-binding protein DprA/Smf involved in DNA uptake